MRFFILSDLHLSKPFNGSVANNILKRLCREIRKDVELGATILFIFLGDIAFRGTVISFEYAKDCLDFIYSELNEYDVKFEFVPGNHDLATESLTLFDEFVKTYGKDHSFQDKSTYSNEYAGMNFIFTDSNLTRDHSAPGKLDIESISREIKTDRKNLLFCHHALSHSHGDTHDTIEDSATVINRLNEIGINFFFHGHVHQADVTVPEKGMVEIGSGCLSDDLSYTNANIQHQFTVGYIRDNNIICVQRWVDNTDGNEIFAANQLFPEQKTFVDPSTIDMENYEQVEEYMLYKDYLSNNRKVVFSVLLAEGKLYQHCAEIEKQANEMYGLLIEQMKEAEGITEQLKEQDQLEWVQRMGNIQHRATKIVCDELIYV